MTGPASVVEYRHECPKCGEVYRGDERWNFCPVCGGRMDVAETEVKPLEAA